jgi:poly(beta-D-mannuronate) lyase
VGLGSRNKSSASFYSLGVQRSDISQNEFVSSAPIIIEHTVGEPKTVIDSNVFKQKESVKVTELRVSGPHTAVISNNTKED